MIRTLAAAAAFMAAFLMPGVTLAHHAGEHPVNVSESVCVSENDLQEAVNNAEEKLQFEGLSTSGIPFKFYANEATWTVWYFNMNAGLWCTSRSMTGEIIKDIQA